MSSYLSKDDFEMSEQYLKDGYIIRESASNKSIEYLRESIVASAVKVLGCETPKDPNIFLNQIHETVRQDDLNNFRLSVIKSMNDDPNFRYHYYQTAKPYLETLVGNELSMQLRVNLSIQMPNDESSLLSLHSDTWSGDSPFEVVVWIPLVDCFNTKSMYLLNPEDSRELLDTFSDRAKESSEDLYQSISNKVNFLRVKYGQVMIFDQGYPHGNRVNEESETRWSMNCRFKGVFTPYGDKKIGEFFEPITIRAASRVGMNYKFPAVR